MVDYLWYRRHVDGAYVDSLGFDVIDEWGRVIPDPVRWPSSRYGKGFTEVANIVHSMGLKFGFHIMRGISTQAVNANSPILDITTVLLSTTSVSHFLSALEIHLLYYDCSRNLKYKNLYIFYKCCFSSFFKVYNKEGFYV